MGVKIKVYTMEGCPHCAGVKDYLREKGVEFEDQAMAEFRELGFRGTPVTLIGDVAIVGFDRERLDTTLAAAG
jgi:glutaredoxin